ncbi:radical SAM protein [Patescibacteria group bacterium]|nr:radical SAM protein [Patescibacteria group bacterium]MBU2259322.1 radical SAM protein [Patescibacteria group bacterium]
MKSHFTQSVLQGEVAVIWHSLFGNPQVVSLATVGFLNAFSSPNSLQSVIGDELHPEDRQAVDDLVRHHYLIPQDLDERAHLEQKLVERESLIAAGAEIDYLGLIVSEACNFRCAYCIHFNNIEANDRRDHPKKFMSFEVAKSAVDWYLGVLQKHGKQVAEVNFGGGEPLLDWSVISKVLQYCDESYGGKFDFRFSINTNASLLTPEIVQVLKRYSVAVATSLDGLRTGNDRVRMTKAGLGTYDAIVHGFDVMASAGYPLDGFSVTVTKENFPVLDESVINWASDRRMKEVRIDIDVTDLVNVPLDAVVSKLMCLRRYARAIGVEVFGFWSRPVENLNTSVLEEHVGFCGAIRGNSVCVSPNGTLYACGYSTSPIGHLSAMDDFHSVGGTYHSFVLQHMTGRMQMCRGCMIEGQCGGGCHITQEYAQATRSTKVGCMCVFYRRMAEELLRDQLVQLAVS